MFTIIHCVNNLDLGGLERMVLSLARQLKSCGHHVSICCIEDRGDLADEAEQMAIPVHALNMEQRGKLSAFRSFCAFLRQHQPVIIHSHNFKPFYYSALATLVHASNGHIHTRHGAFVRHHRATWRYRLLRQGVNNIVTVSADGRDELAQLSGLSPEEISVIPNGVDTEQFHPVTDKFQAWQKLRLSSSGKVIVTIARLSFEKDLGTLLRAFQIVLRSMPTTELWIAGDGPERQSLEALSRQLHIESNTRFLGRRDDVSHLLQAGDIFSLSSLSEGFSIALIEAAASGLPMIATDVGGNREIVNPPECGLLVSSRDPVAMAKAYLELLGDPTRSAQMATAARERVLKHYSIGSMCQQYVELYKSSLRIEES